MGIKEKLSQLKQQIKQDIEYKRFNKKKEKQAYKEELAKARIKAVKGKARRDAESSVNRVSGLKKLLKGTPKKQKVKYRKPKKGKARRRVREVEQQAKPVERELPNFLGGGEPMDFFGSDKKGKKKGGWDFF